MFVQFSTQLLAVLTIVPVSVGKSTVHSILSKFVLYFGKYLLFHMTFLFISDVSLASFILLSSNSDSIDRDLAAVGISSLLALISIFLF